LPTKQYPLLWGIIAEDHTGQLGVVSQTEIGLINQELQSAEDASAMYVTGVKARPNIKINIIDGNSYGMVNGNAIEIGIDLFGNFIDLRVAMLNSFELMLLEPPVTKANVVTPSFHLANGKVQKNIISARQLVALEKYSKNINRIVSRSRQNIRHA
jgi:hypothetical protein